MFANSVSRRMGGWRSHKAGNAPHCSRARPPNRTLQAARCHHPLASAEKPIPELRHLRTGWEACSHTQSSKARVNKEQDRQGVEKHSGEIC